MSKNTCQLTVLSKSPGPTSPNIFPIVHGRDKFSNRKQS